MDVQKPRKAPGRPAGRIGPLLLLGFAALNAAWLGASAYFLVTSRARHEAQVRTVTENNAATLRESIESDAQRIDQALLTVVDSLQDALRASGQLDPAQVDTLLGRQESRLIAGAHIRATDATGRVIYGTDVRTPSTATWADRDFFALLRRDPHAGLQVTAPIMGKVSNVWVIAFARRYNDARGQFAGVVAMGVPVSYFTRVLSTPDLGPQGIALLRDASGGLAARWPPSANPDQGMGTRHFSAELHAAMASGRDVVTFHARKTGDGVERIDTYRRLHVMPYGLVIGEATREYLQTWRREVGWTVAADVLFMLMTALSSRTLWRLTGELRRESRSRAALLRNASDGAHILDAQGRLVEASAQFCAMLGYEAREILGARVTMWHVGLSDAALDADMERLRSLHTRTQFEARHRRKDGSMLDVELSVLPLEVEGKWLLFAASRDITQRKAMEAALKANARKLQRLASFNGLMADVNRLGQNASDRAALFDAVCREAVARPDIVLAWIGRPTGHDFEVLARAGDEPHDPLSATVPAAEAWDAGRAQFVDQPDDLHCGASAALPLRDDGILVAVAVLCLRDELALDPETRGLLVELAAGIERGLQAIRQRARIANLQGLYQALTGEGDVVLQSRSAEDMLARTCEALVRDTAFHAVWMGQPDAEGWVRSIASAGTGTDLLDGFRANIHHSDRPPLVVRAWRSGEVACNNDHVADPNMAQWQERLAQRQWRSALAAPVHRAGAIWALLVFVSPQPGVFDKQTVALCERVAELLGHGLDELDLKQRLAELQTEEAHRARHDALTGLPNRFALDQHLPQALARARRSGQAVAVGMLDLDDFKPVNDRWGHPAGDRLLQDLAQRLHAALRESDFLARLGGDEFVVVLEGLDVNDLQPELERALMRLHGAVERPFEGEQGMHAEVGMSMGVALFPRDASDADALLRHADAAMYHVKQHKARRPRWWTLETAEQDLPEPLPTFDAYDTQTGELMARAQPHFEATSAAFVEAFYASLATEEQTSVILSSLSPDELDGLKQHQRNHLAALVSPVATRADIERRARHAGRAHALVGVSSAWLTRSTTLYRQLLGEHLSRSTMAIRDRYRIAFAVESRLQDDMQAELNELQAVMDAYLQILAHPLPAPGALWTDVVDAELAMLAALPGIQAAEILRPSHDGVFQVEASAGPLADALRAILGTAGKQPSLDMREPTGQGLVPAAWRSGQIQRTAGYALDDRTAPWHADLQALGVRSMLAVAVPGSPQNTVLVLGVQGAYANQFTAPWMRQFTAGLQQRWAAVWQRCNPSAQAPAVSQEIAQVWREQLFAGGLELAMQPVIDLRTGSMVKVEALARLRLQGGDVVPPAAFLPLLGTAELDHLFRLALDQALAHLVRWHAHELMIDVAVNLPPSSLLDPDCPRWVEDALREHGVSPQRLTLELLETHSIDTAQQDESLERLTRLGVKLAMDDLGSGYSSLQRLSTVRFDTIKIDQGLLLHIRDNPVQTLSLISTIIQMGRDFEREVVVEGLEDADMIEAATLLGARLGQGYGLARPMPPEALLDWARTRAQSPHGPAIRSDLGALAYHWVFTHDGADAVASDPSTCPLTPFLQQHAAADPAVLAWHAQAHRGGECQHGARKLLDWLVARVQAKTA